MVDDDSILGTDWIKFNSCSRVSIDGEQISWLNEDGLFNVHVGEMHLPTSTASYAAVVPRKCE